MTKQKKVVFLSWIVLGGLALSLLYHWILSFIFHLGYPYNTFLFRPQNRWMDFLWPYQIYANPYAEPRADFQNFPFLYRLAALFSKFSPRVALCVYLIVCLLAFYFICSKQFRIEKRSFSPSILILTFLTYPFLIAFDRANFEILVFCFLYLYIALYKKISWLSAVFLGFSIALKAFPVILAILLLADRRYKEILIAAAVSLLATYIGYAVLPGGLNVNVPLHLANLQHYTLDYAVGNDGFYFGNSLWGALKFLAMVCDVEQMKTVPYFIFIFGMGAALSLYIVFLERSFWKKVALLVCALNLFPQVSGDYKLLHLLIPLFLFVNQNESDEKKEDWFYLIIFGLLLIPKDYYHLSTLPEASIAVVLNPLLMLVIVLAIIYAGLVRFMRDRSSSRASISKVDE